MEFAPSDRAPTEQQPGTLVCLLSPAGKGAAWSLWGGVGDLCRGQSVAIVTAEEETTVASVCTLVNHL